MFGELVAYDEPVQCVEVEGAGSQDTSRVDHGGEVVDEKGRLRYCQRDCTSSKQGLFRWFMMRCRMRRQSRIDLPCLSWIRLTKVSEDQDRHAGVEKLAKAYTIARARVHRVWI